MNQSVDRARDDENVDDQAQEQALVVRAGDALFEDSAAAEKTTALIGSFVTSVNARGGKPLEQWLTDEFRKHPTLWKSEEELTRSAQEIMASTRAFNDSRESLQQHLDLGQSKASWLAREIEKNAGVAGSMNVGKYANTIDQSLADANRNARDIIMTRAGEINQNPNLDGFIAEQHHVDTFNIDAVAKGSGYRARMVHSREANSVDIEIVDAGGNVVSKYQSKYGSDAGQTDILFDRGEYTDQERLVPEGHGADVPNSTECIEADGVRSRPLSKEEAKRRQEDAQAREESRQYEWKDANRISIAKQIGKQALLGACIAAGMQGARILGRRAWNRLNGQENPSVEDDLKDFFESSVRAAGNVAAQVAVSGALVVAVKNGWLGAALRGTPAGLIANIACIGLQNAKVLYKLGKGELTQADALDEIGNTTVSAVCAIAAATEGAAVGAALGTVFGPAGTLVGGFVGGVAGGIAGGYIGETIYSAGKSISKTAISLISKATQMTGRVLSSAGQALQSIGSAIASIW
ncbi:hypothetical protein [Achromobacter spanius]|uniref:hypothetical protein n=1 Tax=Achromobacter spanius TaxID=217203 RepID=UPI0032083032